MTSRTFNYLESSWNEQMGKRAPTLAHVAARELRQQILSGALTSGQALLLTETAERLGMSVMPVREALRRLEFEGLVEQLPQKGARVSRLVPEDVEDIYHARICMESRAVFRAVSFFDEDAYQQLSNVLQEYRQAYEAGDEEKGRFAHEQFHFGLYTMSRSAFIVRIVRLLWDTSERYRRLSVHHRGSLQDRIQEHQDILESCRLKDEHKAADLMAEHLKRTLQFVKLDIERQQGLRI